MKTNSFIISLLASAALLAAGCQESQEYADVVYFTGTEDTPVNNVYIDGPSSINITVTSSRKVTSNVEVSVTADAAALAQYNAENGTSYEMLPASSYRLGGDHVTIESGSHVSTPLQFEITSLDDIEWGKLYCMPLRITKTSDGTQILAASQKQFILINQLISTKGVNLNNSWYISMEETMKGKEELKNLPACTMEIRMFANGWRESGHMISTLIGVEENFLLRVGDESIKNPRQLQLAGRGTSITAPNALSTGRWYHIAVVDNGSEMTIYIDGNAEVTVDSSSSKAINLGFYYNSAFSIGQSANDVRYFNGYVSEARVWRRALSAIELKNNQCFVDPTTAQDLIGYWRLDEADGKIFKDLSGNGYDGKASATPMWTNEFKCPVVE